MQMYCTCTRNCVIPLSFATVMAVRDCASSIVTVSMYHIRRCVLSVHGSEHCPHGVVTVEEEGRSGLPALRCPARLHEESAVRVKEKDRAPITELNHSSSW